jgi:hypothetical protein
MGTTHNFHELEIVTRRGKQRTHVSYIDDDEKANGEQHGRDCRFCKVSLRSVDFTKNLEPGVSAVMT